MSPHDTRVALQAWENVLGATGVDADIKACEERALCTFPTSQKILAILKPETREHVQECLRIANIHKIPLYPVSRGLNWGYGSQVPAQTDCVLLDLSQMNRILEFNEELAYVQVEPGVTQDQLYIYLQEHTQGRLWIDATGSSQQSSLIGNTLERGHGSTPYCDHIEQCAALEVVLPNGDCIHTGFGAFPDAQVIDRWGVGPNLDGLFSQSSFGIVTKMTILLMPAPERAVVIQACLADIDSLSKAIEILRPFRLAGLLKSGPHFGNSYFFMSRQQQFPWNLTNGATPLNPETMSLLFPQSAWMVSIGLYGSRAEVTDTSTKIRVALGSIVTRMTILTPELIEQQDLGVQRFFHQMTGGQGGTGNSRLYWRKKNPPPADPAQMHPEVDRCGVLSVPVTCSFRGSEARSIAEIFSEVVLRYGFEPNISLFGTRPRILQFHTFICYDREIETDDRQVIACHDELYQKFNSTGYYPHRLNLLSMLQMEKAQTEYKDLLKRLKETFDPHNILAPGRYSPK